MNDSRETKGTSRVSKSTDQAGLIVSYAGMRAAAASVTASAADPAPAMTPEEHRLEDLKQMASYKGPVVSFDVQEPYYLASCDHCGWVGSSELCGTSDADDVHCPRCHSSGADCGKVATAGLSSRSSSEMAVRANDVPVTAADLRAIEELIIDLRSRLRHADDCGPGCTCYYGPLMERSRALLPVRMTLHDGSLFALLGATRATASAGAQEKS